MVKTCMSFLPWYVKTMLQDAAVKDIIDGTVYTDDVIYYTDDEEQDPSFYLLEETPDERQRKNRVLLENQMKYNVLANANANDIAAPFRLSKTCISCQPSAEGIVQWKQAAKTSMVERNNTSDCVSAMQTIGVLKNTPWMGVSTCFSCSSRQ